MFVTEDKSALDDINNFQIFMTVMRDKESMEKKHSVLQVLTLFFPKYDKVLFTPQSLLFQSKEGNVVIDEKKSKEELELIQNDIFLKGTLIKVVLDLNTIYSKGEEDLIFEI